jgi:protein-S-isoprenylcysteine O-methyltransferase Ste14
MFYPNIIIDTPDKVLYLINNIVVAVCLFLIILAVLIDFVEFQKRKGVRKEKKSIVETGTMFLFFFFFYSFIRFNIGHVYFTFGWLLALVNILGLTVLIIGCFVNIKGRFNLGKNWSNQIKIYDDHTFISKGMYSVVRHPLYASIIWMFLASSVIYLNYLAFASTLLIFIPFMYYRAKQEENLLVKEFGNYIDYQKKVGMFFPKIKWNNK